MKKAKTWNVWNVGYIPLFQGEGWQNEAKYFIDNISKKEFLNGDKISVSLLDEPKNCERIIIPFSMRADIHSAINFLFERKDFIVENSLLLGARKYFVLKKADNFDFALQEKNKPIIHSARVTLTVCGLRDISQVSSVFEIMQEYKIIMSNFILASFKTTGHSQSSRIILIETDTDEFGRNEFYLAAINKLKEKGFNVRFCGFCWPTFD